MGICFLIERNNVWNTNALISTFTFSFYLNWFSIWITVFHTWQQKINVLIYWINFKAMYGRYIYEVIINWSRGIFLDSTPESKIFREIYKASVRLYLYQHRRKYRNYLPLRLAYLQSLIEIGKLIMEKMRMWKVYKWTDNRKARVS